MTVCAKYYIVLLERMMDKTGKNYEEFVRNLQQAILDSEEYVKQKNIKVEKNKIIKDNNGINREFDLYWEYELGGIIYKTVIECKDYNTKINVNKIDELLGKLHDIPGIKPLFASKKGYNSGAIIKARCNNIELLIVREQNASDWINENGNHLTKIMDIKINNYTPATITKFETIWDGRWVKENRPDIDMTMLLHKRIITDKTYIDDISKNEKFSIMDLTYKLLDLEDHKSGSYERTFNFSEAYIIYGDDKYKLLSIKVSYFITEPMITGVYIDFSKELNGVIEYLERGIKKKIFAKGDIQQDKIIMEKPKNRSNRQKRHKS